MIKNMKILVFLFFCFTNTSISQHSIDDLLPDSLFMTKLLPLNEEIIQIKKEYEKGNHEIALQRMAKYFTQKMSVRYFYDWQNFSKRFDEYKNTYPEKLAEHERRANEHIQLFNAATNWKLPFDAKDGSEITPYKLRHLARQHKALDIAVLYYIQNENSELLAYLVEQVNSLANSYILDEYDKEGNAIFESFRAGYRIYNWLFVYNTMLASKKFTWRDQLAYLKTFYYHADELRKETKRFRYGNHHTKGLVALALTSILFPEFDNSQDDLDKSLKLLTEHLLKEIKPDGFQFERSVHYHKGDIDNYFYVYKLARINHIELPSDYVERFKMMFTALTQIAMPNKKLPVLQDDTDAPWAEFNNMHSALTIGSILFEDSRMKYFTDDNIPSKYYWHFREDDLRKFLAMESTEPAYNSIALKDIGYYVMRNGWDKKSDYLIISAGLSDRKPDHQHGDMLGIYGYSNNNVILPNYQCRYFLDDYKFFKNSFVKNVALVDSIPYGQKWKGNRGGSGFGKFKELPNPKTLGWITNDAFDFFVGSHDAYSSQGINYYRKVVFIKDGLWIVKDEFLSDDSHNYQQVWQGHFTEESKYHIRSTFPNGGGLDIIQLNEGEYQYDYDRFRGKGNVVINNNCRGNFSFTTLLYPFAHFEERGIINDNIELPSAGSWIINNNQISDNNISIKADQIISSRDTYIALNASSFNLADKNIDADVKGDYAIVIDEKETKIISLNYSESSLIFNDEVEVKKEGEFQKIDELICTPGANYRIRKIN